MRNIFENEFGYDDVGNIVATKEVLAYAIFDEVFCDEIEDDVGQHASAGYSEEKQSA